MNCMIHPLYFLKGEYMDWLRIIMYGIWIIAASIFIYKMIIADIIKMIYSVEKCDFYKNGKCIKNNKYCIRKYHFKCKIKDEDIK